MLKIVSPRAELAVLRGMTHKNKKIAGLLLSLTDSSYFHSEESVEIFKAIRKHMIESGESPTYRLMVEDPDLSEEAREYFRASNATIQTTAEAQKAARILNKYRQRRGLYNLAAHINAKMQSGNPDIEKLLEETATAFNVVRTKKTDAKAFLHFGKNNNSDEIVDHILYGDRSEDVIPTSIKVFDEASGGFAKGSLVTIGANTSGGKSTLALSMAIGMAEKGYKVLVVPLEMSEEEMTGRLLANISKTSLTKILLQRLASGEKELVSKRHKRWKRKVAEAGGRCTIFKPQEDMTIEDIMTAISAYTCDVVIVDYISLLKGVDGDDMWRALGAVARYAKINAEIENRVNILLCQVGNDGVVRYSRAISEHSTNSWVWVANAESKESGITKIEQTKSRNSMAFPFNVKMVYEFMRVEDLPNENNMGEVSDNGDIDKKKRHEAVPNLAQSDI